MERMETTLDLPEELVRALQRRAARERRAVHDCLLDILREAFSEEPPVPLADPDIGTRIEFGEDGLPRFRASAGPPPPRLSLEEVLALEQAALGVEDRARVGVAV
jgi:plasmid stability protein